MRRATYLAGVLISTGVLMSINAGAAERGAPAERAAPIDPAATARFAALALKCLHSEYPNHISHTMDSDADALPPRRLTPAFYGCFDWHSDVHGHWLLVRLVRLDPDAPFAAAARAGTRPQSDTRERRRRGGLSQARRPRVIRTAVRSRMAAAIVGGAAFLGRPAGAGLGDGTAAAGSRGGHRG